MSKHNKNFPIEKVSRTRMAQLIGETKGKFFTSTHTGKDGESHTINGIRTKTQDNKLGYISVYSNKVKELRLINPQTLTELSFKGTHYVIKK